MVIERVQQMSVEEFIDFAESNVDRYEYIDGELYQMTGGKLNHFVISMNIAFLLRRLLADRDCQVLGSGMLVKAGEDAPGRAGCNCRLWRPRNRIRYTSPAQSDSCRGSHIAIVNRP